MKKVICFGTFDIIHKGHLHMFKQAKKYGDYLVVIVGRDKTVTAIKGKKPTNSEKIRLQNIKKIKIIDKARLGYLDDKYRVVGEEKPEIVAIGYDQRTFIDNLENVLEDHVEIVRLSPYKPEIYKSSKML